MQRVPTLLAQLPIVYPRCLFFRERNQQERAIAFSYADM